MRLLALRGGNLTSLAEPFELAFDREPLLGAGLFAIIGPTGAGKSTLLDALCLALYDQVPRLGTFGRRPSGSGTDAPDAGESRLAAHDVRQMLRHGASEGFAEVDFADAAGTVYRARWQVWRARRRPGGRLQAQELTLTRLDTGQPLGGGKMETLAAIRDRVGLDFDQFRRSVLLAQGDFDAFLRAQPKDRASLLELITGTEIYGRISQAAHERARAEKEDLRKLEWQLASIQPLPPDNRQALEDQQAEAKARLDDRLQHHQTLQADAEWHRRHDQLQTAAEAAEKALTEAEAAEHAAAGDREQLDRVRQALPLAPLVRAVAAHADRVTTITGEAVAAEKAHADARAMLESRTREREAAAERAEAAEKALAAAEPDLRTAADLDTRIETEAAHLASATTALATAEQALGAAEAALRTANTEQDEARRRLDSLDRWLAEHAADRDLADDPDRIRHDIDALAATQGAAQEAGARARSLKGEAPGLRSAIEADAAATAAIDDEIAELAAAQAQADAALASADLGALQRRRDALQQLCHALDRMADAGATLAALTERLAALDQSVAEAHRTIAGDRSVMAELDRTITDVEDRLAAAGRALDLAAATDSDMAVRLRARLISGEPCPVCGASDHAVDAIHSQRPGAVEAQSAQVDTLRAELAALSDRRSAMRDRCLLATAAIDGAEGQRAGITADLQRTLDQWQVAQKTARDAAPADLAPDIPSDPADNSRLDTLRAGVASALAETDAAIRSTTELARERDHRAREIERLGQVRQTHREAILTATDRLRQVDAELAIVEARGNESAAAAVRLTQGLRRPLSFVDGWTDLLPGQTEMLHRRCREIAAAWQDAQGHRQAAAETAATRSVAIATLTTTVAHAAADAARQRASVAKLDATVEGLRSERSGLFDGRPAALVRSELQGAGAAARQALAAAQQAEAQAATAVGSLGATLEARRHRLTSAEEDLSRSVAERDRLLARIGLPLADAEAAIALGEDWAVATEARLNALSAETTRAATVLAERRHLLSGHVAQRPDQSSDAVQAALAETERDLEACRQRMSDIGARLTQDDDRRVQRDTAERQVAERRAEAQRWFAIDDLIGSADGSAFRRFAQSLTLDRLLALANRHLAGLAPRYRLQRVPGADMEVQVVDQDMGDEVRSIASLSGGETFLASLALALALANISSGDALADCLFIDEGFGSLDAESLEMAVSALDALQATGRRVGVISHVDAIMERISVQVRVRRVAPGRSAVSVTRA